MERERNKSTAGDMGRSEPENNTKPHGLSRPHKTESCLGNMTRVQAGLPQGTPVPFSVSSTLSHFCRQLGGLVNFIFGRWGKWLFC